MNTFKTPAVCMIYSLVFVKLISKQTNPIYVQNAASYCNMTSANLYTKFNCKETGFTDYSTMICALEK